MKKCEVVSEENGELVFDLDATEDSVSWMQHGRLKLKALAGDEEARKECERMENTPLYVIDE
jgi:hypothetical protein